MNKDQLWETTLDREARTLLQVKIREVDEADDIFVKLTGDVVEPRREFIQDNALSVVNLDVCQGLRPVRPLRITRGPASRRRSGRSVWVFLVRARFGLAVPP